MNRQKPQIWFMLIALSVADARSASSADFLAHSRGTPIEDSRHHTGAQRIPGKVCCAYYDRGGEGVAYHDSDAKDNGSGALIAAGKTGSICKP
jgi:hypothetical protein